MPSNSSVLFNLAHAIVRDPEDKIVFWSKGAEQLYGWSAAEATGKISHELLQTQLPEPPEEIKAKLLRDGEWDGELVHTKRDGNRITIASHWVLHRDEQGRPSLILEINNNVTERQQNEERLRARERQQAAIAELGLRALSGFDLSVLMNEAVALIANTLDVEYCSVLELLPDGQELLVVAGVGWQEGAVGKAKVSASSDSQAGYTLASTAPVIVKDLRTETRFSSQLLLNHGVVSAMTVIIPGRARPYGVLGAFTTSLRTFTHDDINFLQASANVLAMAIERKQSEEEREQLLAREQEARHEAEEANRLKDEFLATLSHELRTPLTSMLGWARLLRSGMLHGEAVNRALESVERNANAQKQLIDDILDVSRIITGKLRLDVAPMNLVPVVEAAIDAVRPAAEAKNIQIQVHAGPRIGLVSGDAARLQQVAWNLLTNAVKFTPEGGRVEVHLERVDASARIRVSDTGRGIRPEFLPYVFERFRQGDAQSTRKHGGLGIGLALVRHIVEMHGGTVSAESPGEGLGATFTVTIPLARTYQKARRPGTGSSVAAIDKSQECPPRLNDLRVLVVDDDTDTLEFARTVLANCGAHVATATSANEALRLIEESAPEVLISDIAMPEMDGYALISQIRRLPANRGGRIPAIALTAYVREEDRMKAYVAGFQTHLPKPIEPHELITVVASFAGRTGKLEQT